METIVVGNRRNHHQCYSRNHGGYSSMKLRSFGSPPSGNFHTINCRTFQSREGLLPTPSKTHIMKAPVTENSFSASFLPNTSSSSLNGGQKPSKGTVRNETITTPIKFKIESSEGHLDFPECWAGPAYSNSPPPSSLPIPKFSLRAQRTASLDLPNAASEVNFYPIAKSAPASPTRENGLSWSGCFDFSDSGTEMSLSICDICELSDSGTEMSPSPRHTIDISVSATLTLRRILNLDCSDN